MVKTHRGTCLSLPAWVDVASERCLSARLYSVCSLPTASCDSKNLLTPTPTPPCAQAGAITCTLSGHVFEILSGSRVPAVGFPVIAVVETVSGCASPCIRITNLTYENTTSDSDGRYHFPRLPSGSVIVLANSSTPRQVCGALAALTATTQLDIEVTSRADPQPSPTMPPLRLTGQVYETTPAGRVGVGGALVYLEWHSDGPFLEVYADADGRYVACGIPANRPMAVSAWQEGFNNPYVWHQFSADATLDLELKRLAR